MRASRWSGRRGDIPTNGPDDPQRGRQCYLAREVISIRSVIVHYNTALATTRAAVAPERRAEVASIGVDSAYVARLLGHSSTKMVDLVYGRLSPETLAATVLRLPMGEPCVTSVQEPRARRATNETAATEASADDARKRTNRKRA